MAVYDKLPESNLRAEDIRDTLLANGADWSNSATPNANYLPNYFKREANINMWSLRKPVKNSSIFGSVDQSGLGVKGDKDKLIFHDLPIGGDKEPLRLGDFRGYNAKELPPMVMPEALNTVVTTPSAIDTPKANLDLVNIGYLLKMLKEEQIGKHRIDRVVTSGVSGVTIKEVEIVGNNIPNISEIEASKSSPRVANMTNRQSHEIYFTNSSAGTESGIDSRYYFSEDGVNKFDLSFTNKVFFSGAFHQSEGIQIRGFAILSNMGAYNTEGVYHDVIPDDIITMTWLNITSTTVDMYIVLSRELTLVEQDKYTSVGISSQSDKRLSLTCYVCKDQRDDGYMLEIKDSLIPNGRGRSKYYSSFDTPIPLGATNDMIDWAKGKPVLMIGGEFSHEIRPNKEYNGVLFDLIDAK